MDPTIIVAIYGAAAAVLGAALALISTLLANKSGNKLAREQRETERIRDLRKTSEDRRIWWRERRLHAHEEFYRELTKTEEQVYSLCERTEMTMKAAQRGPTFPGRYELFNGMKEAASGLGLISSEELATAAEETRQALQRLLAYYEGADSASDFGIFEPYPMDEASIKPLWERTGQARRAYLQLAKSELGVTDEMRA